MKKLSDANPSDFSMLLDATHKLSGFDAVEKVAQAFIDIVYEHFQKSLLLLRLFSSLPYSALPTQDQQLVNKKANDSGTMHLLKDRTPILTLLATRGQKPDWNERDKSQGFRCIPLVSRKYGASLSMLSMQFKSMNFDFSQFDDWNALIVKRGRADQYSGILYVREAGTDKDDQNRMVVPRQEFVADYGVKTALGFGGGYTSHPTIIILFAFTNEILSRPAAEPFTQLLEAYRSVSGKLIENGRIFAQPVTAISRHD
ncbi:MAG: hypothetical protein ABSE05_14670 [Syntrophales bacterium]|jgi:hypothetical protein